MDLLTDLLPPPERAAYQAMELAEAALQRHQEALRCVPQHDSRELFWALRPSPVLKTATAHIVYESHCDELIQRTVNGESRKPGTNAEVLCALLACSLKAPLRQNGLALVEHLAIDVLKLSFDTRTREVYAGQILADLANGRQQLAQDWR